MTPQPRLLPLCLAQLGAQPGRGERKHVAVERYPSPIGLLFQVCPPHLVPWGPDFPRTSQKTEMAVGSTQANLLSPWVGDWHTIGKTNRGLHFKMAVF